MMTSVTLPSGSGPTTGMHGVYPSNAVANNDPTTGGSSEPDYDPPQPPPAPPPPLPSSRPAKRSLSSITPPSVQIITATSVVDSCKKRRKQAMPVRISAEDANSDHLGMSTSILKCPFCHKATFNSSEELQTHLTSVHINSVRCKSEPKPYTEEYPMNDDDGEREDEEEEDVVEEDEGEAEEIQTTDMPWMATADPLSNKDWLNTNLLTFPGANHLFMGLPSFAPTEAMPPRQPFRIFNPDAYCELCNKEFCNKYFLKTHKANKHGVFTDPPPLPPSAPTSSSSSLTNEPTFMGSAKLMTNECTPSIKVEPKPFADTSMYNNQFNSKLLFPKLSKAPHPFVFNGGGDMQDQTASEETTPATTTNDDPHAVSTPSPKTTPTECAVKQELGQELEAVYTSPGQDPNNRYRRIGVMNPKAFCEICCKEYCNKYFLRTHKMKRHGIYIPDERDKDCTKEVPAMTANTTTSSHIQTSPLNLIMGEQSANGADRKTSSPSDISCDTCGIRFQNASLFQLHNVSVHAKLPTMEQLYEERKSSDVADRTDNISEDLQKLQTMILQLNDLDVGKANSCVCNTCGKEFENRYYMHAHMMADHGTVLDESSDAPIEKTGETTVGDATGNVCDVCGKDFSNFEEMRRHMFDAHKPTSTGASSEVVKEEVSGYSTTADRAVARTMSTSGNTHDTPSSARRNSMNLTPTSSYCEICNKELCNKYFMKTHMQRMHGIEIENGAQIGGVVCDICNKELCSKYFLRVHKHNTHGIVEYAAGGGSNPLQQPRKFEEPAPGPTGPPPSDADTQALKPADLADLSHRYFTHFTEVCTLCSRRFRSTKWLKAHLLSDHGQTGAEKWSELEQQLQFTMTHKKVPAAASSPTLKIPSNDSGHQKLGLQNVLSSIFGGEETSAKSYNCSFCPFTTPILPFLFVHERSHTLHSSSSSSELDSGFLKCPICMQSFPQPDALQHHVFSQHPFLPLPPFFNGGAIDASKDGVAPPLDTGETSKKAVVSTNRKLDFCASVDIGEQLKEAARTSQLPAAYALPQDDLGESLMPPPPSSAFVMQAFRVQEQQPAEESSLETAPSFMPSIVFLPVTQKLSAPITATFTLTPA